MRKTSLLLLTLFLMTTISACAGTPASPKATPVPPLFQDEFTNNASGWTRLDNASGSADYANSYYHIQIKTADTLLLSNPGKNFPGDVSVQVDARKLNGSDDNFFGVLCHYRDPDNYYMFLISNDGYSGIVMRKDGIDVIISPGLKFLPMQGIKKGSATNHIQADCVGDKLSLYANGAQVSLAYDDSLTGGDVGLAARSGSLEGGVDIRFDKFTVSAPSQP